MTTTKQRKRCRMAGARRNILCAKLCVTSALLFDGTWHAHHMTVVMPSRGLCWQNGYARMLDFDPTQLCSTWTRTDMSAKLNRNKFMSDHCSGIAMWTRPMSGSCNRPLWCCRKTLPVNRLSAQRWYSMELFDAERMIYRKILWLSNL